MDLLEDLRIPLLNFKFVVIYIIQKISVLIKNYLNYLKVNTSEFFFKKYNRFFFNYLFHNI